ncbi:MAG: acetate--CoA ligase family protein [Boseongicola sp.]|nr:acetate--CoA ligase family protein [Boseongicola sp.]
MRDLTRLLRPKSLAVFGGGWAENVVRQCQTSGFGGEIWPVHPTRDTLAGVPCFRSVEALPGVPDAAFLGVNRTATLEVVEALRDVGAGGAICFASGFAETGHHDIQSEFVVRAGEMPVLGPNCYGLLNCLDGVMIWPDQQGCRPVDRGVAILTQSSNIGMTLSMQRRGLPIAYLACLGNAAQTGLADLAAAMLADTRVTALGVYMEGVGDARAFAEVVAAARLAGKGVVVLKAGRSEMGRSVAMTHTASLAGGGEVSSAYLSQIGAGEVASLPQMAEALKVLHVNGPLSAKSFLSVSCSGGEAGLVADAAAAKMIAFPPVPKSTRGRLSALLGPLVSITNPLDYHTFIWGDRPLMNDVFCTAASGFDATFFIIDQPDSDRCDVASFEPAFDAIMAARAHSARPVFAVSTLHETTDEVLSDRLMRGGVTPLLGIDDALAAVTAACVPKALSGWRPWSVIEAEHAEYLDEVAAKALLKAAGIAVPKGVQASDLTGLDLCDVSPPFALKGLGFAHKSEAGAVRLNISSIEGELPMAGASGYLLEEMVLDGVAEILIGTARDPVYGATLTLGSGGIHAELLQDTVTLVSPVTAAEVETALRRLKLWPLLDGYRGGKHGDVAATVDVALAVQAMMAADARLIDIEINPLIVRETGAVAVDALIRKDPT